MVMPTLLYYNLNLAMPAHILPVCTGCLRPWTSSRYRTCDACRRRSGQNRYRTVHDHISTPVATPSQLLQQRKRHREPSPDSPHRAVSQNGRDRRRRVEAEPPTPRQSLIDNYNKRKAATARFPPKITPLHIRAAMRRYEQVVQEACAGVETSCASCGEFMAKAGSKLIPVDDDRVHSMEPTDGAIQLDNCGIADGTPHAVEEGQGSAQSRRG